MMLDAAIKDEDEAANHYLQLEESFFDERGEDRKLSKQEELLGDIIVLIGDEEQRHKQVLESMRKLVCI